MADNTHATGSRAADNESWPRHPDTGVQPVSRSRAGAGNAIPDHAAKFYETWLLEAAPIQKPEYARLEWVRNAEAVLDRLQLLGWTIKTPDKTDG